MSEREFTHPQLGEELRSISGYYVPREEQVVPYQGRQVLLVLGDVCMDTSCCGGGSWSYVQVPGFLVRRQAEGSAGALQQEAGRALGLQREAQCEQHDQRQQRQQWFVPRAVIH